MKFIDLNLKIEFKIYIVVQLYYNTTTMFRKTLSIILAENLIMDTQTQYENLTKLICSIEVKLDTLLANNLMYRPEKKYLNIKEACIFLGISKTTIYRLMKQGEICFTSVGGSRKLLKVELEEYILNNRTYSYSKAFIPLK